MSFRKCYFTFFDFIGVFFAYKFKFISLFLIFWAVVVIYLSSDSPRKIIFLDVLPSVEGVPIPRNEILKRFVDSWNSYGNVHLFLEENEEKKSYLIENYSHLNFVSMLLKKNSVAYSNNKIVDNGVTSQVTHVTIECEFTEGFGFSLCEDYVSFTKAKTGVDEIVCAIVRTNTEMGYIPLGVFALDYLNSKMRPTCSQTVIDLNDYFVSVDFVRKPELGVILVVGLLVSFLSLFILVSTVLIIGCASERISK